MIKVDIYKDRDGRYKGFRCAGHAGYADYGSDIVCSSVSAVAIGTCNSIEKLAGDKVAARTEEETGLLEVDFPEGLGHDGTLLMDAMSLTLKDIAVSYGDFIELGIEEV